MWYGEVKAIVYAHRVAAYQHFLRWQYVFRASHLLVTCSDEEKLFLKQCGHGSVTEN